MFSHDGMNPTINNETVVNYLLGSLSDAETERLDELSITDDEFAAALNAAEKDLVDAYVHGELTAIELSKFRSHYLVSPLRRAKLDFAQAFGAMAEKHYIGQRPATEGFPAQLSTVQEPLGWFARKSFFPTPRLAWQWGFAVAAIALLMAASWLMFENRRLRQQVSQTQAKPVGSGTREEELQNELERQRQVVAKTEQDLARVREERERLEDEMKQRGQESKVGSGARSVPDRPGYSPSRAAVASFTLMPQMRGVQQMPTISIPAGTEQVAIQLELEPNDYSAYRVALRNQTGNQTLWRSGGLKASGTRDSRTLKVSFPSALLRPEVYVLRVIGVSAKSASEVIGDYSFRVMNNDP